MSKTLIIRLRKNNRKKLRKILLKTILLLLRQLKTLLLRSFNCLMAIIKDSLTEANKGKAKELWLTKMEIFMKETGRPTKNTATVRKKYKFSCQTKHLAFNITRENLDIMNIPAKESAALLMETFMRGNGRLDCSTDKENWNCQQTCCTKDTLSTEIWFTEKKSK